MKTKLSKRILSLFLAVLMMVTSAPLFAFNALADNSATAVKDDYVLAAEEAMKTLNDKLAQPDAAYKNVKPAYDAYVKCQEAIDAYLYGRNVSKSVVTTATSELQTAITQIQNFSAADVTNAVNAKDAAQYKQVWSGDSSVDTSLQQNVLWAETGYNTYNARRADNTVALCRVELGYPNVTFLYDGTNVPQSTMHVVISSNGSQDNKSRYACSVMMNNTDGLVLDRNWTGRDGGNFDANWDINWGTDKLSYTNNQNGANVWWIYTKKGWTSSATRDTLRFANTYKYTGKMGANTASIEIYPSVTGYFTSSDSFRIDDILTRCDGNTAINVINYKMVIDAIIANASKMKNKDLATFSQGGAAAYFAAMDAATAFNPLNYFTNGNDVNGCATEITRLVNTLNATTVTENNNDYVALRTAIDAKRLDYGTGVQPVGSKADSWNALKSAYENATNLMTALSEPGVGYSTNAANVVPYTTALNNATLVFEVEKLDTTALQALITEIDSYASVFVTSTKDTLDTAVRDAKVAIWGAEENYPSTAEVKEATPENQALYAQVLDSVKEAKKALRIDPNAELMTTKGYYSLVTAIALKDTVNKAEYTNFATLEKAVADAELYKRSIAVADFADYNIQLDEYKAEIVKVVTAFGKLRRPGDTFLGLPNGTVASVNPTVAMTELNSRDTKSFFSTFRYTPSATIIRTSRSAANVPYGSAEVWAASDAGGRSNSAIDSISINATAPQIAGQNGNNRISGSGGSQPNALDDNQKATYAGCLTNGAIQLKNIKYMSTTGDNAPAQAFVDRAGNRISASDAHGYVLDDILGNTDGTSQNPVWGAVTISPRTATTSGVNVAGDLTVNLPATNKPSTLGLATTISSTNYTLNGNYGMVGVFHTQGGTGGNYTYYQWLTSESTGEKINSTVTVIDLTNLIDLVNECKTISAVPYTTESWTIFETALSNAQGDPEDKDLSSAQILSKYKSAYTNLYNARAALKLKKYTVQFVYKDATGNDLVTTLTPNHGDTYSTNATFKNNFDKIKLVDYVDGDYTMEATGAWEPAFDPATTVITGDVVYTAQYEGRIRLADFTAYNTAKASLMAALTDGKFTANSLKAVQTALAPLTYFDVANQANVTIASQPIVDTEKATLDSIIAMLQAVSYDKTVADAVKESIALASKMDPDKYDNNVTLTTEETVNVAGKDVVGLIYESQAQLDAAIANVVNSMVPKSYKIILNGKEIGTAPYGTAVAISSDGTLYTNADITSNVYDGAGWSAWRYHYATKTTQSIDKYVFTAKSIGFIVTGDAYVTSTPAESPDSNSLVTIKDANTGKAILADIASAEYTLPTAPARAYYNFVKYVINGVDYKAGDKITLDGNLTIQAVYNARVENSFTINYYDNFISMDNGELPLYTKENLKYDEVVTFSSPDAYCWVEAKQDVDTFKADLTVLHYGPTYTFNVYKSMADTDTYYGAIIPLTREEFNNAQRVDSNATLYTPDGVQIKPIAGGEFEEYVYADAKSFVAVNEVPVAKYVDSNVAKFSLIGFSALTEGYTVVENGFLFSKDPSVAVMTVQDVDGTNVFRFKSSVTTDGGQFVVDIKNPANSVTFKYCAYAIIKDANGKLSYIYSNTVDGSNNF